jgi:hypothetical protein
VPPVKLKLIEFASDREPGVTAIAVDPVDVIFTTGVPLTVRFVAIVVNHGPGLPVPVPEQFISPVPKAIERILVLLELNFPVVQSKSLRSSVPRVRKVDLVTPVTKLLFISCIPPPGASIVIELSNVFPAESKVFIDLFEKVIVVVPEGVIAEL